MPKKSFFSRSLPLETETTRFIFVSAMDLFLTFLLLYYSNRDLTRTTVVEANPVAQFFIRNWGTAGLVFFKFGMVAFIVLIAQIIARKKLTTARLLLNVASLGVAGVVIYSFILLGRNLL